jgi:hypothetical protein
MSSRQPIRILILSDTWNHWPYAPVTNVTPPPDIDVLIHCGNLTQLGGLSAFHIALENVKSIPAGLRLVIAGNQDLDLDEAWIANGGIAWGQEDDILGNLGTSMQCQNLFASAKDEGVYYLQEGVHEFELPATSGGNSLDLNRTLRVYASPYTPAHNGYAFTYGPDEDRFNPAPNTHANANPNPNLNTAPLSWPILSILGLDTGGYDDYIYSTDTYTADLMRPPSPICTWSPPPSPSNPIPNKDIDIVITHGPPKFNTLHYRLDMDGTGQHTGCEKLRKAVMRAKPKLHCFGHVREGRGAVEFEWAKEGMHRAVVMDGVGDMESEVLEVGEWGKKCEVVGGGLGRTMFVNAAVGGRGVLVEMEI